MPLFRLTPILTVRRCATAFFALAAMGAGAGELAPLATSVGAWKPKDPKQVSQRSGLHFGHTKEQLGRMSANMAHFMEGVHRSTPFIDPPRGFDVTVYATMCEDGCAKGKPIVGKSSFLVHEYTIDRRSGKPTRIDEGPAFNFHFNDIGRIISNAGVDESGDKYLAEPHIIDRVDGHSVYTGGLLVLTKNKNPLFSYVTMERGLTDSMRLLEANLVTLRKQMSEHSDPKEVAYLERIFKRQQAEVDKKKARLAAMTPEQLQAPYEDVARQRFVTVNKAFYDPALPASALQLVVVDMYKFGDQFRSITSPYTIDAVERIQKQLGLQKMLDMLE